MKLTRESLKQLIRENFKNISEEYDSGSQDPVQDNDVNLRWSRYMDNYKSDPRIRKATNSCLSDGSSSELSELITDILESIQDETIKDRFLIVVPQMVEDRLKETK